MDVNPELRDEYNSNNFKVFEYVCHFSIEVQIENENKTFNNKKKRYVRNHTSINIDLKDREKKVTTISQSDQNYILIKKAV